MILGLSRINWVERLTTSQLEAYFHLIDRLIVVVDSPEDVWTTEDERVYYRYGDYLHIYSTLEWLSVCKAYPRKTLFSVNFSLVEIPEGCTAEVLKRRWVHELQSRGILQ